MLHDLSRIGKRAIAFSATGSLLALLLNAPPAGAVPTGRAAAEPSAASPGSVALQPVGSAPEIPAGAHAAGPAQAPAAVDFDVVLKPRDPRGLQAFATGVSTPESARYRHFLSTAQFAEQFGQTTPAVSRVDAALRAVGLAPGRISANDLVIPIATTVSQASTSLRIRFERYKLASGRLALTNTSAPRLPAPVAQLTQAVIGLSNLITAQPSPPKARSRRPQGTASRSAASGPQPCAVASQDAVRDGAWTYAQLAKAYALTGLYARNHMGAGTTVALFELEPWSAADVSAFQACYRTAVPVRQVSVDGGATGKPGDEVTLDIETALALAPKSRLLVYDAPAPSYAKSTIDEYTRIVDDHQAQVLSSSYGLCEAYAKAAAPGLMASENTTFEQAATEGISVFVAAGDDGSEACYRISPADKSLSVQDPAAQPFVTAVGGTTLTALGPPPAENVWNDGNAGGAGGGGISSVWTKPSWQAGRGVISRFSSGKPCHAARDYCREVPDVSASADPTHGYLIYYRGKWTKVGGTSAAAPLWAALLADIDSQTSPAMSAGFLNPQLYALPTGTLNDIRLGNNDFTGTHRGRYPATRGYDIASGLGSPVATRLAKALRLPVVFVGRPGTRAPPRRLGPYRARAFGADFRPLGTVSGVSGPTGRLAFSPDLVHLNVGYGWNTWSNGYRGGVYAARGPGPSTVTVTLPARTAAIYFYGEPVKYATFDLSATAQNGSSSGPVTVNGEFGARYFGFYGTAGFQLRTITITCKEPFAIGEFGIAKG